MMFRLATIEDSRRTGRPFAGDLPVGLAGIR
jgi:hypothetical protein